MSVLVNDLSFSDVMFIALAVFVLPILVLTWIYVIKALWFSIRDNIYDWYNQPRDLDERQMEDR